MLRNFEYELLNKRFDFTRREIQESINYYTTIHLSPMPQWIVEENLFTIDKLENTTRLDTDYLGICLEIEFNWEGNKHIWTGATYVGDSAWARREHLFGYIEINPVYVRELKPVDVKIVCGWPPLYYFFMGLSEFIDRKFSSEIYRLGFETDGEILRSLFRRIVEIQNDLKFDREIKNQILSLLNSLRHWAISIQKRGLPLDKSTNEAIENLSKDHTKSVSIIQTLELIAPLIPGLLNSKTQISVESKKDLDNIWGNLQKIVQSKDV